MSTSLHNPWDKGPSVGRVLWIAAAFIACAYAPMLYVFFQQLWWQPQYQFFPFVIGAFGWLLWTRWQEAEPADAGAPPRWPAFALTVAAWFMLLAAALLYNPWASMASLILLVASACLLLARRRHVTYLWGIWALLWLMLPVPLGYEGQFIAKLQLWSSQLSSFVLDRVGVPHIMAGNTLHLSGRQLFVDEACSGIISVKSLIACGVIYGVWRNRSPLHVVALAMAGVLWAILMNVGRIASIAMALHFFNLDWTEGAPHEILSLVVFVVAFGMLISTDVLLEGCTAPIVPRWGQKFGGDLTYGRRLAEWWERLVAWGDPLRYEPEANFADDDGAPAAKGRSRLWLGATAFGILAAFQWALLGWAWAHPAVPTNGVAHAEQLEASSLPNDLAELRQVDFSATQRDRQDIFGEFSRTYRYGDANGQSYLVSCDFPFSQGWHELTVCYSGVGWEVVKRDWASIADDRGEDWTAVEVDLKKSDGSSAFVTWTMFDEFGEPVAPPAGALRDQVWRLLVRRNPLMPTRQMFQVQVFVSLSDATADEQKATARKMLQQACERLRREVLSPSAANATAATRADGKSAEPLPGASEAAAAR